MVGYTKSYFGDDACSESGARKLADKVAQYWREKAGCAPELRVVDGEYQPSLREAAHQIKSDMINGWPREIYARMTRGEQ